MKTEEIAQIGPFVFINKDKLEINYFSVTNGNFKKTVRKVNLLQNKGEIQCNVYSDYLYFKVFLNFNFDKPDTFYAMPEKLMVISDIEGNFNAFKNLLINNGITDTKLNWIFGKGHLVLNGDFIDRGKNGIHCLWLIIRLEQLAEKSGGKVHFILGNHEIMNMQGNHRYSDIRYAEISRILNIKQKDLYGRNTFTGRWLSTKNLVEKIGDFLFTHAGICPDLAKSGLSLEEINEIGHKNVYHKTSNNYIYENYEELVMSINGPYWYRNYFYEPKINNDKIDLILNIFKAKFISVGHTRQNQIERFYNGKVINTNVDHSENKIHLSEALFIEKNIFYRVNEEGGKKII